MKSLDEYIAENEELRARLEEAEETLRAIQSGEVDALVVSRPLGHQVYTLKGEERTYRLLVESINEGALTLTPAGIIMYANQAISDMLGIPLEHIMGASVTDLVCEDHRLLMEQLLNVAGSSTARAELCLQKTYNGEPKWVALSLSQLVVDEFTGISMVVTDLTERKEHEDTLRTYQEHLEELVQTRTEELESANEELAAANDEMQITNDRLSQEVEDRKRAEDALKQGEEHLRRQNTLVQGISQIFKEALTDITEAELGQICLRVAEEVTGSAFGFIGELDSAGTFSDLALSDPGWAACQVIDPATGRKWLPTNLKIHWIYGRVVINGKSFFTNDPPSHPDSIGVPEGHSSLTAFLGVPLHLNGKVIGMIGLGNKEGGYRQQDLEAVESLAPVIVQVFLRKRAEEEIHRSRQELKTLTENLPDVVDRFDREFRHLFISPSITKLTGLTYQQMLGKTNRELGFPENQVAMSEVRMKEVFQTGQSQSMEFEFDTPEGHKNYQAQLVPEFDSKGNVISVLAVSRDITDRKRMEDALRESERRYSALFANKINGIAHCRIITDEQGQPVDYSILKVNDAYEQMVGIRKADIEGHTVREVFPGVENYETDYIGTLGKIALDGGETRFDAFLEPTRQYLSIYAYSPRQGEFTAMFTDITDRKRAEVALRESESILHAFFDSPGMMRGIIEVENGDLRYVTVNKAIADTYGLEPAELSGKLLSELNTPPEIVRLYVERCEESRRTDQAVSFEVLRHLSGADRWLFVTTSYFGTGPTGFPRFAYVILDITDRKKVEEALRESEERYRSLFSTLLEGFCIIEMVFDTAGKPIDYRFLEINPAFEAQTGLHDARGKLMSELASDHEAFWFETYGKVALTGEPARFVNQAKALNRWFDVSAYRVGGQESRKVAVLFSDITLHKQAEEALRESEEHFRLALEHSPVSVAIQDRNYVYQWAYNQRSRRPDEIVGKTDADLFAPEDLTQILEVKRRVIESGNAEHTQQWVTSNNRRMFLDLHYEPVRDSAGEITGIGIAVVNLTEQKLAEDELVLARQESEHRAAELEAFVTSMSDGIVLFDIEPKILLVNEAAKNLFNPPIGLPYDAWVTAYKLETVDGMPVPLEDYPSRRALKGEITREARYKMITPWSELLVSITAAPAVDAHGHVFGGSLSFRDISQRIEFEQKQLEVLAREHRIADTLQKALIPTQDYEVPCCDVAVKYEPASQEAEVGGDFFDIFDVGNGKVGVLIGDVSGKGLQAAIRVAAARHAVRSYAYIDPRPGKVLSLANDAICKDPADGGSMITAFFAVVDTQAGTVTGANGGHESPILCSADGTGVELKIGGMALGVFEGYNYQEECISLKPGDTLVLVTDGITEARPDSLHLFGVEGVLRSVSETCGKSLDAVTTSLIDAAKDHAGGILRDDAAIVALRLKSAKKSRRS